MVREVVVTATAKFAAAVGFNDAVAGTEHCAPFGAPLQLSDAAPPMPAPPMESA
jgi:hypothetical protein